MVQSNLRDEAVPGGREVAVEPVVVGGVLLHEAQEVVVVQQADVSDLRAQAGDAHCADPVQAGGTHFVKTNTHCANAVLEDRCAGAARGGKRARRTGAVHAGTHASAGRDEIAAMHS